MELTPEAIQTILDQYSDPANDSPLYQAADGRIVIGTVVDNSNHLHYVIRNEDQTCELADAENVYIGKILHLLPSQTVTVSANNI